MAFLMQATFAQIAMQASRLAGSLWMFLGSVLVVFLLGRL